MSLFKHAFVRGINDELVRLGIARYPTKYAADEVADIVADQTLPEEPAAQAVSPETAADVAATLVDAANKLVEETGMHQPDATGQLMQSPEEEELKTSAAQDLDSRAYQQAEAVMIKAAMGSTIEGGDKGNTLGQAADVTGEAQLEAAQRPENYAHMGIAGVGDTETPFGRDPSSQVGREEPHPEEPATAPSGTNSVIEQSKTSQLRALIQKIAMGSTIEGGDKGNSLAQAGALTGEGKLELDRRPENYATGARGQGWGSVPNTAVIGTEMPHPQTPSQSISGSNSVIEASKLSSEDPYLALFKKTAEETAPHLPLNIGEDEKIAHIRRLMGLNDAERTEYIALLHKDAGANDEQTLAVAQKHAADTRARRKRYVGNPHRKDRTHANQKMAADLPPALAAVIDAKQEEKAENKKEEDHEAKESPAKEKAEHAEEEKKEGHDLLARIRHIAQGPQAHA